MDLREVSLRNEGGWNKLCPLTIFDISYTKPSEFVRTFLMLVNRVYSNVIQNGR
jgi:hypothetical protein